MLFYTSKNNEGNVHAIYSGRFAFIFMKQEEYKTITGLCNGNDMVELWSHECSPDFNAATAVLAHEYTHKNIYTLSESGLILNGYRYWVRTRFLFFNDYRCVKKYYRMRTVHLMETRSYHEELAHHIDTALKSSPRSIKTVFEQTLNEHYLNRIQTAEDRIAATWKSIGLHFNGPWEKHYCKLGKWFHENFGVRVSYLDSDQQCILTAFADQGVSNDLENIRPEEPVGSRIKKVALSILFLYPLHYRETYRKRLEWYWIGQRTQFTTLKELYGMDYPTFFREIMQPSILFVMEWAGIPLHTRSQLFDFAEDTLQMNRAKFMRRWKPVLKQWRLDPSINRYLIFFHLHGN